MDYTLEIKNKKDAMATLSAARTVCKALNLDCIHVQFEEGFSVTAKSDSNIVDLFTIYRLEIENKKLKKKN